jgi:hypothetical protein
MDGGHWIQFVEKKGRRPDARSGLLGCGHFDIPRALNPVSKEKIGNLSLPSLSSSVTRSISLIAFPRKLARYMTQVALKSVKV